MKRLLVATALAGLIAASASAQDSPPVMRGANSGAKSGIGNQPPVLRGANSGASAAGVPTATPEAEPEVDEDDIVRTSTSLISVPAEVMDRNNRYIGNLRAQDFHIFENGIEQKLSYFASVQEPFTVALLLDVSGSTQSQLQSIRIAANAFISRLRPTDRLLLITFDGKINILTEAVGMGELRSKKLRLDAVNDGTVLYDAVGFVLNQRLAAIRGRKAIVLLTDGVDGTSKRSTLKDNLRDAEEGEVIVYPVHYNTLPQLPDRLSVIADLKTREKVRNRLLKGYATGETYLQSLAEKTGGRVYATDNLANLPEAFAKITEELGRKYSLGYYPSGQIRPGEKRSIKVKVNSPNLVVRARESYVAETTAQNVR